MFVLYVDYSLYVLHMGHIWQPCPKRKYFCFPQNYGNPHFAIVNLEGYVITAPYKQFQLTSGGREISNNQAFTISVRDHTKQ